MDGYGDYQENRENVLLWDAMNTIKLTSRSPTIISQLTGQAQTTAKTVVLWVLFSKTGVTNLMEELNKTFEADNVTLLHINISSLFDFS